MAARAFAQNIEDIMATGDLTKILSAVEGLRGESREALAALSALKVEVSFATGAVQALSLKVDRMDDQKASRAELQSVEVRIERNVAEVKASAAFEAGRLTQDLTSRLDIIATDLHDFRESDLKQVREELKKHEGFQNRLTGGYFAASVFGAVLVVALNWALKFLLGK